MLFKSLQHRAPGPNSVNVSQKRHCGVTSSNQPDVEPGSSSFPSTSSNQPDVEPGSSSFPSTSACGNVAATAHNIEVIDLGRIVLSTKNLFAELRHIVEQMKPVEKMQYLSNHYKPSKNDILHSHNCHYGWQNLECTFSETVA